MPGGLAGYATVVIPSLIGAAGGGIGGITTYLAAQGGDIEKVTRAIKPHRGLGAKGVGLPGGLVISVGLVDSGSGERLVRPCRDSCPIGYGIGGAVPV